MPWNGRCGTARTGYTPAAGIWKVREAVAASYAAAGMPIGPDRVILTSGTSEGIELALSVLVDTGDEVLVPVPTYPFYTATLTKLGARSVSYRTDPHNGWMPDLDHVKSLIGPATRAIVIIDPNNPTGAVYSTETRRALVELADTQGIVILADEVYADLAYDEPVLPIGALDPDAPVISLSSISKTYQAPGWRAGWLGVGGGGRLDAVLGAINELADGRLCSTGPMQFAIMAALTGNDDHKATFVHALRERAEVTTRRLNGIEGISCVPPRGGVLRDAEGRAATWPHRRGLRDRAVARHRAVVCLWLGVRHRTRRRLPSYRLPGDTTGA